MTMFGEIIASAGDKKERRKKKATSTQLKFIDFANNPSECFRIDVN